MATTTPTTGLTYEDLVAMQERAENELLRLELIDGELFVSPAPNLFHQRISMNYTLALGPYVRARNLGEVFAALTEVRLAADVAVQPGITFVSRGRSHLLKTAGIDGVPNLVVEILSPSNRQVDLTRKKALYERFGVPEYWILDYDAYDVAIFAMIDGRYVPVPVEDEIARSRVVPGFEIAVADLFEAFP